MAEVLADNVIDPSETSIDKVWRSIWEKPLYANTKVEHGNKWIKKLETHMTDSLNTWGYEEELLIRKIGKTGKNIDFQIIGKLSSTFLGLIALGMMTRYLGQEQFGWYITTMAFLQFIGIMIDFGLIPVTAK